MHMIGENWARVLLDTLGVTWAAGHVYPVILGILVAAAALLVCAVCLMSLVEGIWRGLTGIGRGIRKGAHR